MSRFSRVVFGVLPLISILRLVGCTTSVPNDGLVLSLGVNQAGGPAENRRADVSQGKRTVESKSASGAVNVQGWSSLGSGLDGSCNTFVIGSDATLYAGGSFTTAGGVKATSLEFLIDEF